MLKVYNLRVRLMRHMYLHKYFYVDIPFGSFHKSTNTKTRSSTHFMGSLPTELPDFTFYQNINLPFITTLIR